LNDGECSIPTGKNTNADHPNAWRPSVSGTAPFARLAAAAPGANSCTGAIVRRISLVSTLLRSAQLLLRSGSALLYVTTIAKTIRIVKAAVQPVRWISSSPSWIVGHRDGSCRKLLGRMVHARADKMVLVSTIHLGHGNIRDPHRIFQVVLHPLFHFHVQFRIRHHVFQQSL